MTQNNQEANRRLRLGLLLTVVAALCFGLYPATSKIAYHEGANPAFLIIATTFFRAAVMTAIARLKGFPFSDILGDTRVSMVSGLLQALSIIGIIASLQYIPGPVMITIVFTHTLMLLAILHVRGETPITPLAGITSVIALIGITMVVNIYQDLHHLHLLGISLAFISALATASRLYTFGVQVRSIPHEIVGARAFVYALPFTLILLPFQFPVPPYSTTGTIAVLFSCLSLGCGTIATFAALSLIGSFRLSLMLKIEPVCTSLYAWLIIGEVLRPIQYLGIAVVLSSLAVFQLIEGSKKSA